MEGGEYPAGKDVGGESLSRKNASKAMRLPMGNSSLPCVLLEAQNAPDSLHHFMNLWIPTAYGMMPCGE